MNRFLVSLVISFVTCLVSAQTADSIAHHNLGRHSAQVSTFMEMSDGSILGGILMADEYPPPLVPLGYLLHKVSRLDSPLEVSDTLFLSYEQLPWQLTVKGTQANANILAEFVNDFGNGSCYFRIRHFDDDLNFYTKEVIVPLADFIGNIGEPGMLVDPNGDIIFSYYNYYSSPVEFNFVRMGLDGTIKYQKKDCSMEIQAESVAGPIVLSESPLRYCYWGEYREEVKYNSPYLASIKCYLLDSLFTVKTSYTLPRKSGSPDYVDYCNESYKTLFVGLDDGCLLVATSYNRSYGLQPYIEDDGVAIMKYDSCFNLIARIKFLSEPYLQYAHYCARPVGLERDKEGNIYFAYFTNTNIQYYGHYYGQISVVKLDYDLNIVWQRHCLEPSGYTRDFGKMIVLEDNSVAVTGINSIYTSNGQLDHTEAFYVVVNDDYDGMEEQGFIIRPYAYYPNPAQDELHLQYSPDITPTQIELYDMQGHLVRSQCNGLESLNLEGLASGAYTMRVTLEGGKVFSDKVIKE